MMQINDNVERTRDEILSEGVILAVRLDERAQVLDVCRAAIRGGLRVLEITLTTPGALEVISTMADEGAAIVGGGTVLTAEEARAVAAVGGRFVLSPVFHPEVVDEAHLRGLLAVPGTASPAEILAAHRHGARLVKVFPSRCRRCRSYPPAVRRLQRPPSTLPPGRARSGWGVPRYFRRGSR
jgi:2-dehydro-3-deoxyphosphogluconate aldolase/(4S)-4-hydroxy-2-oxoglutarate aldolase